jgi:hypothetical protein
VGGQKTVLGTARPWERGASVAPIRGGAVPQHLILVVANQTLGGEHLVALVRERVKEGAREVWIVVPATVPPPDRAPVAPRPGLGVTAAFVPAGEQPDPRTVARTRLELGKERLGELGVQVGGEVGDEDPFQAVSDVLERRRFDEVIISTLPSGLSNWLRSDLPSRVRRTFEVPVTTVTARVAPRP